MHLIYQKAEGTELAGQAALKSLRPVGKAQSTSFRIFYVVDGDHLINIPEADEHRTSNSN